MKTLIEQLHNNKKIPMHMPGHKRNTALSPYLKKLAADLDITEIAGFDNLHNAEGILKESMQKAAKLRNADRAFYLVNGTTCGILAAVCALLSAGDKAIVARNCHKSVYNALELAKAEPVFVMPEICKKTGISGHINNADIEKKIKENPDAKLVIITSPTYEGVVSDIKGISEVCHKNSIPLLVDAAHGAHLGFGYGFPEDAMSQGADISVESLHKTLPSLTQTAICYCKEQYAEKLSQKLSVFQTSSPSYLLMASIDGCINLLTEKGGELFSRWQENLEYFYEKCENLENIGILKDSGFFARDPGKIVLLCHNGKWLFEELEKKGIECEMASCGYVVAMTGMGDTREMLSYLAASLAYIDKRAKPANGNKILRTTLPVREKSVAEAKMCRTELVKYEQARGRVAAEYIWAYPPGIPLVIPGEAVSEAELELFRKYDSFGIQLSGTQNREKGKILVIK